MPGAVPDVKHLLELMTRAAGELKAAQREATEARALAESADHRAARATEELKAAQQDAAAARAEGEALTKRLARLEADLAQERARSMGFEEELEEARNSTYVPLAPVVADLPTPEASLTALPEDQTRVGIGDPGLLQQRIRTLESELATGTLEQQELEARLKAAEEAAAQADTSDTKLRELEASLADAKAQLESRTDAEALAAATSRNAQLEHDLATLRARRDELNIELGKVEKERNTARARVAELDGAAQAIKTELEGQLAKEREKHQATAQKLLEARARGRETEGELEATKGELGRVKASLKESAEAQRRALDEAQRTADSVQGELRRKVAELEGQLEHATSEWRHVERQYEQLHKEMLLVLDQRDEARRDLALLRERLGRFT
jgi:chromosome segregation ATPase